MKFILAAALLLSVPAVAAEPPVPIMAPMQANPQEVNQMVSSQIGQLTIQLAQAQSLINAQAKEIERLSVELAKAAPAKK